MPALNSQFLLPIEEKEDGKTDRRFKPNMVEEPPRYAGNIPLLSLRTRTRGPAPTRPVYDSKMTWEPDHEVNQNDWTDPEQEASKEVYDIADEILDKFRPNTFFRNFEIKGPADRLLIYGILFVGECLSRIKPTASLRDATKEVNNLALDLNFVIPGDPGFPLNQMYDPPRDRLESELLRQYLSQVRQELAARLLAKVYADDESKPSRWWLGFTKRKFMGKSM